MFDLDLTDRQRQVLAVLRSRLAEQGYPPTVREIGEELGLTSSSTVHSHLAALERAGVIERDPTKPRALSWGPAAHAAGVTEAGGGEAEEPASASSDDGSSVSLPLVGRVAAGEPILADHHVEEYVSVPTALLRRSGDSFLLRVRGDSMVNAGILDGDWVVVRSQPDATSGEIVVALVGDDSEATCKRLRREGGRVVLVPENDELEPVVPDQCDIVGVVTGVMRAL